MKKKSIFILSAIILLGILFIPIPRSPLKDGGTRVYTALTYKIVHWHRICEDGIYDQTRVYFLPDRFKSIDELWAMESADIPSIFVARIVELGDNFAMVRPLEWEPESKSCDQITFGTAQLENIGAEVGSLVRISYGGQIMCSYPAQIQAFNWQLVQELRQMNYPGTWLGEDAVPCRDHFENLVINDIYADCFFATPIVPMPYVIKVNGVLSDQWCVGDQVSVTCENSRYDEKNQRYEGDLTAIEPSTFEPEPGVCYKPVIYLYPEQEMKVSLRLQVDGGLTCTYPAYGNGWNVTASPDGTLTDPQGQQYNYLYWEGKTNANFDFSTGFCVKGADTAAFLEDALAKLGLNRREANEFIVYWLPLMEPNAYNLISFQTDRYTDAAVLDIDPAPDTLIRVFMAWKSCDVPVDITPQNLTAPERTGFTVVEWGGTQIG
jgi:hypothetical protein